MEGLSGQEQIVETCYRFKLNDHLELSPSLQWIQRAAGDPAAPSIQVYGLRAAMAF
jgi:carbohydrate-selective porin OprB